MKIRFLGHGSFKIKTDENTLIYIDPYSGHEDECREIADIILVSHSHYDHYSPHIIRRISNDDTVLVTTRAIASLHHGSIGLDPGQSYTCKDISIVAVKAVDMEIERGPLKPKTADNVPESMLGFYIETEGKKVYYASDTGFFNEMEKIRCDIALLPIGGSFTMDADAAAKAVSLIRPRIVIPMNYGQRVGRAALDNPAYASDFADILRRDMPEVKVIVLAPSGFVEV